MVRALAHGAMGHGVDPLSYVSFQLVFHDWYNKGRGMSYPVGVMMHIKHSKRVAYVEAAGFLSQYQNDP